MVLLSQSSITLCGISFEAAQKTGVKLELNLVPGFLSHSKDISEQIYISDKLLTNKCILLFVWKGR